MPYRPCQHRLETIENQVRSGQIYFWWKDAKLRKISCLSPLVYIYIYINTNKKYMASFLVSLLVGPLSLCIVFCNPTFWMITWRLGKTSNSSLCRSPSQNWQVQVCKKKNNFRSYISGLQYFLVAFWTSFFECSIKALRNILTSTWCFDTSCHT